MANKPTVTPIAAGAKESVSTTNANNNVLAASVETCLGRGGTGESPNSMEGNLDMDTNKIINVGTPQASTDAARLGDIPSGATSPTASSTTLVDSGGYFTSTNVEGALEEIGDGTFLLDEDDMASNSNTQGATQQSIKTYSDNSKQYKNYLINGSFLIWQENTSFTLTAGVAEYTADMHLVKSTGGSAVVSRQASTLSNSTQKYLMRITGASGVSAVSKFIRIEASDAAQAKRVMTYSAVISNESGGDITPSVSVKRCSLENIFSSLVLIDSNTFTTIPTGTEQTISWTVDLSSVTPVNGGVEIELDLGVALTSGYVEIADERFEAGSVRSTSQLARYAEEMASVNRYQFSPDTTNANADIAIGYCFSTTLFRAIIQTPTPMFGTPTLTASSADWLVEIAGTTVAATNISISSSQSGTTSATIDITVASGLTAGHAAAMRVAGVGRKILLCANLV